MKPQGRILCVSMAVVLLLACSLITPTMARYSNVASTTVTYGHTATYLTGQTMTADTEVYDFGVYTRGADETAFEHTVRIQDTGPVAGVLRFAWDETTRSKKDVAVYIDNTHYTAVQSGGYTDYTVSTSRTALEIPFSLMFSTVSATRVAELTVSWYPNGGDEPTLFSRYLLALVAEDTVGTTPTFVAENTTFITDRLLQVEVTTPSDSVGVTVAPADGVFPAGTRYCSTAHVDGATLLRDTAIFVPRTAAVARLYVGLSDVRTLTLRVSGSQTQYSDLTCTPPTAAALTVSLSDAAGVLNVRHPLTITLTESAAFRDGDWDKRGDTVDLTWQVLRREGGSLYPVAVGEKLTVTVTRTESGGTLTVSVSDGSQPAGTYLLLVTQYYHGYPVLKTPVWFFIDYR